MESTHQIKMQSMGLFAIYGESLTLAFKLRILFSQIALTFIFPLSLTIFAQLYFLRTLIQNKFLQFALLEILASAVALASALLSTSAVVHAITCFYASREITYRGTLRAVVPRVWKRLAVTLFCGISAVVFLIVSLGLTFLWKKMLDRNRLTALGVCVVIAYAAAVVGAVMVGQMASVVSVMEGANALGAAAKSGRLMRGKVAVGAVISVVHIVAVAGVFLLFAVVVAAEWDNSDRRREVVERAGYGGLLTLLMMVVILMGLVVETLFYMVCKGYHREDIDRSVLGDHLEVVYLGGNVRSEAAATATATV